MRRKIKTKKYGKKSICIVCGKSYVKERYTDRFHSNTCRDKFLKAKALKQKNKMKPKKKVGKKK